MAVCTFCKSTLVREDDALRRIGQSAELFDDHSPLALGTRGRYQGEPFLLVGRVQMASGPVGGSGDAVVPGWSSMLLPVEHQQRLGSTLASAVPVTMGDTHTPAGAPRPGGTHRSTFLASLFDPGLSVHRWCAAALA